MGETYMSRGTDEKFIRNFGRKTWDNLEDLGVDGNLTLNGILKKESERVW